jgi:hypothetical protein
MSLSGKPSLKRGVAPSAALLAIQSGDLLGFNRWTLILNHIVIQKLVLSRINHGRHTHHVPRFSLTLKPAYSYLLYQKGASYHHLLRKTRHAANLSHSLSLPKLTKIIP